MSKKLRVGYNHKGPPKDEVLASFDTIDGQLPVVKKAYKDLFGVIKPYNGAIARSICEHLAAGWVITQIAELPWWPGKRSFNSWLCMEGGFRQDVASARSDGAHWVAGAMIELALEPSTDGDMAFEARRRTACDVHRWYIEKLNPPEFGNHVAVDVRRSTTITLDPVMTEAARVRLREMLDGRQKRLPGPVIEAEVVEGEAA